MEFVLKTSTKIKESPNNKSFEEESNTCSISQLKDKQPFDKIAVQIKALQILRNLTAENGKNIQHVLIADAARLCKCTLWENFIGLLEPGKSCHLCDFYNIQEFHNKRSVIQLYPSCIQRSRVEQIPDIDIGSVNPVSYVNEEVTELTNTI